MQYVISIIKITIATLYKCSTSFPSCFDEAIIDDLVCVRAQDLYRIAGMFRDGKVW